MTPDDPRHGTDRGHVAHIRSGTPPCPACLQAHARMNNIRLLYPERFRKVPVVGARRRIQALQALGYGRDRVAAELGYTDGGAIAYLLSPRAKTVTRPVDKRIRDVYERLSMKPPPVGIGPDRARRWARRNGFAPPLAWDEGDLDDPNARPRGAANGRRKTDLDPVAVERAMAGDRIDLTKAERFEVVARLRAMGRSHGWIEENTVITKPERYIVREAS